MQQTQKNNGAPIGAFISQFLTGLDDRHVSVLRARYGLDGKEPQTLQAIGDKYGITRERVRQIEAAALKKLRSLAGSQTREI